MKTIYSNKRARDLIRKGKNFRMEISLTKTLKKLLSRHVPNPVTGIVLETGEVIVLVSLIVVVGSVIAYGIYHGYSIRLRKDGNKWYLEFKKKGVSFG